MLICFCFEWSLLQLSFLFFVVVVYEYIILIDEKFKVHYVTM